MDISLNKFAEDHCVNEEEFIIVTDTCYDCDIVINNTFPFEIIAELKC